MPSSVLICANCVCCFCADFVLFCAVTNHGLLPIEFRVGKLVQKYIIKHLLKILLCLYYNFSKGSDIINVLGASSLPEAKN